MEKQNRETKTKKNILDKSPYMLFIIVISIAVAGLSYAGSFLFKEPVPVSMMKVIFWNIEYFFVLTISLEMSNTKLLEDRKNLYVLIGGYLASFCLVWGSAGYLVLNFWFIGSMLVGIVVNPFLAVAFQGILAISYCLIHNYSIEYFIYYFTFGALMILLSKFMEKIKNVVIISIVVLVTNVAFILIRNDFDTLLPRMDRLEVISSLLLVVLGYVFYVCFPQKQVMFHEDKENSSEEKENSEASNYNKTVDVVEDKLLEQLKEYSKPLYDHSVHIGELSYRAAKLIGCDANLAMTGGLYHEIGRMVGKDYVKEGTRLLKNQKVADKVVYIVEEHNIRYAIPTSKEAAIVMLSDSIVSTIAYLKREQGQVSVEDVVDSVFVKRFEKGILDKSKLTMDDIVKLKKFYLETLQK